MIHRARVDVTEGKPVEDHVVECMGLDLQRRQGIADQVAVGQHDSLRVPRRAGRVHDRGEIVWPEHRLAPPQLRFELAPYAPAMLQEAGPGSHSRRGRRRRIIAFLEENDSLHQRQLAADLLDFLELLPVGDKEPTRTGIGELKMDLPSRQRRMRGTLTAAAARMPMSAMSHSMQFSDNKPTRSPGWIPASSRAAAQASASARYCSMLRSW